MKPDIKWTDDCQGKKDYDGSILRISTRYWPQGGGFHVLDNYKEGWQGNESRPEIKPSASCDLFLDVDGGAIGLTSNEFEAETQEEVQKQVEDWVQNEFNVIVSLLKTHYKIRSES